MATSTALQILAAIVAVIVSPLLTNLLKTVAGGKLSRLSPPLNALVSLVLYLLGWWMFTSADMGQLEGYLLAGLGSGTLGTLGYGIHERLGGDES